MKTFALTVMIIGFLFSEIMFFIIWKKDKLFIECFWIPYQLLCLVMLSQLYFVLAIKEDNMEKIVVGDISVKPENISRTTWWIGLMKN